MKIQVSRLTMAGALLLAAFATAAPAAETMAELTRQVRAREIAFAKTMADRDLRAFTAMIAPDVIWLGEKPMRGPAEVVENWKAFFEGPNPPFSWAPEIVEVQEGGRLALTRGPVFDPAGKRVGSFTSIWRREASGEWMIIFDGGCPACQPCAAAGQPRPDAEPHSS